MATKGFGIIGLGMISEFHASAIEHMKGVKLVAGFDPVPGRAEAFAKKHNCRGYDKIEEFLKDPELDIVTVATPSGLHMDGAVAAANAKKHVIVEKPLDVTPEKCKAIVEACEKNGVHRIRLCRHHLRDPEYRDGRRSRRRVRRPVRRHL